MIKILMTVATVLFMANSYASTEKDNTDIAQVTKNLQAVKPDLPITSIKKTDIEGIFELISSGEVYYLSKDAHYIFDGNMIDIVNNINVTSAVKNSTRVTQLKTLNNDELLIYPAVGEKKHFISVFTDTSCPFCNKLHAEIPDLLKSGVEVRYMLYPRDYSRRGKSSPSYQKMVNVWCADNQQQALTDAKERRPVEDKICETPIAKHMQLAKEMGLSGTPMIILDDGTLIPGYRSAKEILKELNQ
jgi:thiol:disulfide interchange protein DsbC